MLRALRRALRPGGRTAYTTIHVAPGLGPAARRRAVDAGPRAVQTRLDQVTLLRRAGFVDVVAVDVTDDYIATLRAWIEVSERNAEALAALEPPGEFAQRQSDRRHHLAAAEDGLLRRALLVGRRAGP